MTTPTAFSAPASSQLGTADLKKMSGNPITSSTPAWPSPHQAPSCAAFRESPSSAATSEVTATRWSGSEAWRSPRAAAMPSAASSGAPAKSPVSQASSASTGWNRKSKFITALLSTFAFRRLPERRAG